MRHRWRQYTRTKPLNTQGTNVLTTACGILHSMGDDDLLAGLGDRPIRRGLGRVPTTTRPRIVPDRLVPQLYCPGRRKGSLATLEGVWQDGYGVEQ